MFSSKARLIKRTGKNPIGRYDFLKLLATEYKTTSSKDPGEFGCQFIPSLEKGIRKRRRTNNDKSMCFKLLDAQEQILANLANFAYDPINYGYIRQLKIIDIFLNALSESSSKLIHFGIAGLCNLCLDAINKTYILRNRGVELILLLLSSEDEDILLTVITTLMFLVTPESIGEISSLKTIKRMLELSSTLNEQTRVKNMATLFLEDYCEASHIDKAKT